MTHIEKFIKERNEALFSLNREKIEAYCKKYGDNETGKLPDPVFWGGVCKAICHITDAPEEVVTKAKTWLTEHGMSSDIAV